MSTVAPVREVTNSQGFERLARLGVQCLDVPSRSLPVGLINRYLMIKQRGLL